MRFNYLRSIGIDVMGPSHLNPSATLVEGDIEAACGSSRVTPPGTLVGPNTATTGSSKAIAREAAKAKQLSKELAKEAAKAGQTAAKVAKAAKQRAKDVSQSLSMLLRHNAIEQGIRIDPQGWVLLDDVLAFVNKPEEGEEDDWDGIPVSVEEIREVVRSSDKQRFAIWETQPPLIRASQGHSMKGISIDDFDPVNLDDLPLALHGTYYEAWEIIKREGLNKMERNHIHLARDLPGESGVISGMRANCQVLVWVDLCKASAAGIRFMVSANGVVLSEGRDGVIPAEYFSKVVDRKTGADLL